MLQNKNIQQCEKLKLVILYAIRWESDEKIEKFKDMLRNNNGISQVWLNIYLTYCIFPIQNSINLINYALEYAGKSKRVCGLFSERDVINKAQNMFKQAFKDVPNVYTQEANFSISPLPVLLAIFPSFFID